MFPSVYYHISCLDSGVSPATHREADIYVEDLPQDIRVLGEINSLHGQLSQPFSPVDSLLLLARHAARAFISACTILVVYMSAVS